MEKQSRVTKKLIAEQLGLSISTVDRALNQRGNVKPETYRKVLEAAQELDYLVNKSASFLSRKQAFSIAVVLLEYPTHFWDQVEKGAEDAHRELRDYGLHIEMIRINDDAAKNVETIRDIVQSGNFDAIALPAADDAYVDVIDQSIDGGFPVCTLNIDAPTSKRLFYVGCNYHNAGKLAGELLCKLIGRSGKVALVTDSWTSFQSQQKITGFREALIDYPAVKMVGPLKMERENLTDSLLAIEGELKSVDGIYVSNAELDRIAQLDLNDSTVLIGHDMNRAIYRNLNQGVITAVICQDPVGQGYLAVKKMFNYLALNEEIDVQENITKLEIVIKENAKFYF
ncbi:LacI family DNA-binding transcriptional regulator [Alicyclobacillus fodiniaquatilis]|jgi:DNA-binding LacI/PurR family transcriptional regulator|uniref:LacI family DNA-binding transcriptional regulator n=1 Tax=Alicyclobacillus fodiniaquatilis TaxID=1661150 RepID=A0ABW4JL38_9BACL